jgi:nickel/cobalt transporter (NicO) family protein
VRRRLVSTALLLAIWLVPAVALAHPLGNFTTNQYTGFEFTPAGVSIDQVLDLAEIPAGQERRAIDVDGDEVISPSESEVYARATCAAMLDALALDVDGSSLRPGLTASSLDFPEGEAGLPTLRLECTSSATWDAIPDVITFDNTYSINRQGWREVVVASTDLELDTTLPTDSVTGRLTSYPAETSADDRITQGTIRLRSAPGVSVGGVSATTRSDAPVDRLAGLLAPGGDSPALPVAMAVALGLGVLHALAPGHGKTVMAAYLVGSRGTLRQAVGLGAAVAVSHTLGVLVLGVVALVATSSFAPDALFPVLSTASGLILVGVGMAMFVRFWRRRSHQHPHGAEDQHHDHDHHDHDHHHHDDDVLFDGRSGWKVLAALGLSGGMVPSTSAVVLLLAAINLGKVATGILLIALFGIGMAGTLIGAGLAVVTAGRRGSTVLNGRGVDLARVRRWLTPVAASVVLAVGVILTFDAARDITF